MKLFDKSTEVESINVVYKNGKQYSIWLPKNVDIAIKILVEDEEEDIAFESDKLGCMVDIHCTAEWDNVNIVEE